MTAPTDPDLVTVTIEGCANTGRYAMAHKLAEALRAAGLSPMVNYDDKHVSAEKSSIPVEHLDQMLRNAAGRVKVEIKTVLLPHV